jgi:cell division protein FtsI (penicillin-binding protein 3)
MMTREHTAIQNKTLLMGLVFSVMFLVIAGRAVYLQVIQSQWLTARAEAQYQRFLVASGKRGTIYDANRQELAVSLEVMSIGAFPNQMTDIAGDSKNLARILGLDARSLKKKLSDSQSFVWVKRKVPPSDIQKIRNSGITGLEFIPEHNRFYPNMGLAAQVLGFTGTDEKGLEGLEFQYNRDLEAASDKFIVTKDALGRRFNSNGSRVTGFSGNNLMLTLDKRIQFIAESALKEAAEEFQAPTGIALVMDPDTGALLAMAHYPEFNPNVFGQYDRSLWRNRAVTDPYEPGSTLKVFLAAAAIDSNVCSPNSIFYCENGTYQIGRNRVKDTHPHQWLSLQQIIKFSSNIGAVKISEITGRKVLYKSLTNFGFGRQTGIDCPGETAGILSNFNTWSSIDTGAISFGQGISVSAVQLLSAVSAIANGGKLVQPYLVSAITAPDGSLVDEFGPRTVRQVIRPETAAKVKQIMATVVTDGGTGTNAALSRYTVCGKTGTAQKIDRTGNYSNEHYTASFVGFAPKNHPRAAVLVILDDPKVNHYGGVVAAPAFRKIVHETLHYLEVEPETGGNEAAILLAQRQEVKR